MKTTPEDHETAIACAMLIPPEHRLAFPVDEAADLIAAHRSSACDAFARKIRMQIEGVTEEEVSESGRALREAASDPRNF